MIGKKLDKGKTIPEIADALEMDEGLVRKFADQLEKEPLQP